MTDAPAEDELDETAGGFLVCGQLCWQHCPMGPLLRRELFLAINARPSGKLSSQIL